MKSFDWTDKAATKIAVFFLTLQLKFTRFMNKIVAAIPDHKMKTVVIVFGLLGGGSSLYLIANAVWIKPTTAMKINPIAAPKYFDKTGEDITAPVVDDELYRRIQAFKKSAYYDSTMWSRPGLGDSIVWLEELYESQRIK